MRLREYIPGYITGTYTGRVAKAQVTYITRVSDWDDSDEWSAWVVLSLDWPCPKCGGLKVVGVEPPRPCECVTP